MFANATSTAFAVALGRSVSHNRYLLGNVNSFQSLSARASSLVQARSVPTAGRQTLFHSNRHLLRTQAFSSTSSAGDDAVTDKDQETTVTSKSPTKLANIDPTKDEEDETNSSTTDGNDDPSSYDADTANVRASLLPDNFTEDEEDLSLVYHRTKHFARPRRERAVGGRSASPPGGAPAPTKPSAGIAAGLLQPLGYPSSKDSGKSVSTTKEKKKSKRENIGVLGSGGSTSPLEGAIEDSVLADELEELVGHTPSKKDHEKKGTGCASESSKGDSRVMKWEARKITRTASFDIASNPSKSASNQSSSQRSAAFGNNSTGLGLVEDEVVENEGEEGRGAGKRGSKQGVDSESSIDRFGLMSTYPDVVNLDVLSSDTEEAMAMSVKNNQTESYRIFRAMAPYIAVHRGSVVVIHVPGEVLLSHMADSVMHDIILLKTLGVKPVLVAGCRPQIRKRLADFGVKSFFVHGNRVCDYETLQHCQSVAGHVRVEIESLLGRGVVNSPTDMGNVAVASGNFVRAIPFGVRSGIDFKYTGTVQKVHARNVMALLDQNYVVLLGHLGYSPSGEIFHCRSEEVAIKAAIQLKASKLVLLHNGECMVDYTKKVGPVIHNLSLHVARSFVARLKDRLGEEGSRIKHSDVDPMQQWELQFLDYMQAAVTACEGGVARIHLVSRHIEGSIITELCTRDGTGLMISRDIYEGVRLAALEDVPSILSLIRPLEERGILVTRPPDQIESEIGRFIVYERDGEVLACCQLQGYEDSRYGKGAVELSCVAVSDQLRNEGIGNALLSYCSRNCVLQGYHRLFVLTTRSQHWFVDRGFEQMPPESLPPKKYASYNQRRKPKVYFKSIESERMVDEEDLKWFAKLSFEDSKLD